MKQCYPRMLYPSQTLDGEKHEVKDAIEEERYTGVKMNADGTPFVEDDDPPQAVPVPAGESAATPEVAAVLDAGVTATLDQPEAVAPVVEQPVDHEAIADALNLG